MPLVTIVVDRDEWDRFAGAIGKLDMQEHKERYTATASVFDTLIAAGLSEVLSRSIAYDHAHAMAVAAAWRSFKKVMLWRLEDGKFQTTIRETFAGASVQLACWACGFTGYHAPRCPIGGPEVDPSTDARAVKLDVQAAQRDERSAWDHYASAALHVLLERSLGVTVESARELARDVATISTSILAARRTVGL